MPRIPLVTEATMTPEQRAVYDAMLTGPRKSAPVGPLAVAMHRPELAQAMSALGLVLRFGSRFEPRLREFTILFTGRYWDCQFEWASHEGEARKAGLSDASIETLRAGGSQFEATDEQAIHDYGSELLTRHFASDATYQRVLALFGVAGVVELTALIGYYALVALTLNAAEFEVPAGITPAVAATRMSEPELSRQVDAELDLFTYPMQDWVRPVRGPDGAPVHNVVIVGGGQAGLAVAFGLRQERISGVVVLDENSEGLEGPWITTARMITLRTLKFLTGPDLGVPALTFRRWHDAHYGAAAWDRLVRIDKADWMRYLVWFRQTLNIPVRNNVRVVSIEPSGLLWALHLDTQAGPEVALTREIVLATGLEGAGARRVPDFVRENLPREVWAHTADRIDFASLRGRRVAVIGGGASAYDNAATALEHGAAHVDMFIRRERIPMANPFRALESSGFWRNFADLDDATRWRFMHRLLSLPMPPPQDSVDRVMRHANVSVHFATPVLDAVPGIRLFTPAGRSETDFLILATGFGANLNDRPELAALVDRIATWSDRYSAPADRPNAAMGRYPYVGSGFELVEKSPGAMPGLRRIRMFNHGSMVSTGPIATGLNGMPFGLSRLVKHMSADFLRDQASELLEEFETYEEPDAWEAVRTGGDAAP